MSFKFDPKAKLYLPDRPTIHTPTIGLAGHFTFTVRGGSRDGQVIADFDNLILNSGLDLVPADGVINWCQLGTGASVPAVTQTALDAYGCVTSDKRNFVDQHQVSPEEYRQSSIDYRFNTGVATGTWAEVGIGRNPTTGPLFCRARILDSGGSPTTITIASDETLDVTYRLRMYYPIADATGSFVISGVTYNYTARGFAVQNGPSTTTFFGSQFLSNVAVLKQTDLEFSGDRFQTSLPGAALNIGYELDGAYVPGSYSRNYKATAVVSQGNLPGGINGLLLQTALSYTKIHFDVSISKDASKTLLINLVTSWARHV